MNIIPLFIILIFVLMIFFRVFRINKPIYLFGILQTGKKALITRIISGVIMSLIVYGLILHYFWALILYLADYLIGLTHSVITLIKIKKKSEISYDVFMEGVFKSNKNLASYFIYGGITLWTFITIYLCRIFL